MNTKFIQSVLIVVGFGCLLGAWLAYSFYQDSYLPSEHRIRTLKVELSEVKDARKAWEEALERGQGRADFDVRFNYLTEKGIKAHDVGPWVLKQITPWFEKNRLGFEKLEIHPAIRKNNMDVYSFTVFGNGKFSYINKMMSILEEDLRGIITGFYIGLQPQTGSKNSKDKKPSSSRLHFSVAWHWLEGAPDRLHSVVDTGPVPQLFKRDPFKLFTPAAPKPKQGKKRYGIKWIKPPVYLNLQGIMAVADGYKAIISGKYVVPGQKVNNYRVLSIEPEEVVLGRGNLRCRLTLKMFK